MHSVPTFWRFDHSRCELEKHEEKQSYLSYSDSQISTRLQKATAASVRKKRLCFGPHAYSFVTKVYHSIHNSYFVIWSSSEDMEVRLQWRDAFHGTWTRNSVGCATSSASLPRPYLSDSIGRATSAQQEICHYIVDYYNIICVSLQAVCLSLFNVCLFSIRALWTKLMTSSVHSTRMNTYMHN